VDRRLIREAYLTSKTTLYLDLGEAGHLCCSAHPNRSFLSFSNPAEKPLDEQPHWLTHHLLKSGIVDISHVPGERIVILTLSKRDRLGTETQYKLICELLGRHANVILVDANNDNILGAMRHVRARQNSLREILPGRPYQLPKPQAGNVVAALDAQSLFQAFQKFPSEPTKALQNAIIGLDEITARELLHRAGVLSIPSIEAAQALIQKIQDFFAAPPFLVGSVIIADGQNRLHLSPLQITFAQPAETFSTLSEGLAFLLSRETVQSTLKGQITNLEKDLNHRLAISNRKLERIEEDLADAVQADHYEMLGNVLMANLQSIPLGSNSVSFDNLLQDQNLQIEIPLNRDRSALENANDYLKRSRKGRKGAPILEKRRTETQVQIDQLKQYLGRLLNLKSDSDFVQLRLALEESNLIKPTRSNQQKSQSKKSAPGDIHPRRYRTREGWLVLVGRNNQENDKLTKGSASDDIFFHVHGCPGSHVILKKEGRAEKPPRSTLKETASLAAYWSKARGSKSAPVSYTEVRYVQKPRGAPPGLVTIKHEKSVMVEPRELQKEDDTST
jgi:predicted ribosome quality control (RQC) complex YloA/Tae2 family protein